MFRQSTADDINIYAIYPKDLKVIAEEVFTVHELEVGDLEEQGYDISDDRFLVDWAYAADREGFHQLVSRMVDEGRLNASAIQF